MYVPRKYDFGRYESIGRHYKTLENINLKDDSVDFEKKIDFLRTIGVKDIL